jgi:hypothetical protein
MEETMSNINGGSPLDRRNQRAAIGGVIANGKAYFIRGGALPNGPPIAAPSGETPMPIVHVPSKNPIGGPQTVTASAMALAPLAFVTSPDGRPRKYTVIVTPTAPFSGIGAVALYAKITMGVRLGSIAQWVACPCVFPVDGSFVQVQAQIAKTPQMLSSTTANLAPLGTPLFPPAGEGPAATYTTQAVALVIDGWTEEGPSILIAQDAACNATLATGPVLVDTVAFTNTNANAGCLMVLSDYLQAGEVSAGNNMISVYVPAQSSVSVGRELLGPFSNAVIATAITPPITGHPATDPNGTNVYATVRGRYFLPQ